MNRIICFGNELHGDDGFGPAVYRQLSARPVPSGWQICLAANRGLDALALFDDCESVIIVDAAVPAGRPGRLSAPRPVDLRVESDIAGHGAGVGYLLRALASLSEPMPSILILAAEMAEVCRFRPELSAPVQRAVDPAVERLLAWMSPAKGIATRQQRCSPA